MTTPVHRDDAVRRLRLDQRGCSVITGRPGEGKTRLAEQMAARWPSIASIPERRLLER